MLRDDEALCVDRVQSFRDRADFNNLNVHVTSNLHADAELRGKSLMKIIQFSILSSWWQELRQNILVFDLLRMISRKNSNHEHSLNLHADYV